MLFLRPKAERLARKLLAPAQPYARQAMLLKKIAELPDKPDKIDALRTLALSKSAIAKDAVELLSRSLSVTAQTAIFCEIAENGSVSAAEAAIDKLKALPASAPAIESLCRIVRRFIDYSFSPFCATSLPGRAVDAMCRFDPGMKNPNFATAVRDVLCEASWSLDYEKPANWVFNRLMWTKDKATLDNMIEEFERRAKGLPLVYDTGRGGWLGVNRFTVFLERLKGLSDRARVGLADIEADLLRRRVLAIPNVLARALSGERYEDVAAMADELERLAHLSVPEAVAALADFKSRPARRLPLRIYKDVDHYDTWDRVTVTETEWVGTEIVSTEKLGQMPAT